MNKLVEFKEKLAALEESLSEHLGYIKWTHGDGLVSDSDYEKYDLMVLKKIIDLYLEYHEEL